jgi:transcriptional regulator with XRE-family HTH domain
MMSAYGLGAKTGQSVCAELKALRLELGYSIREMAALMDVPHSTYQCYESGSRQMPAGFIDRAREWRRIDMDYWAGLPQRVDERIAHDGGLVGEAAW